MSKIKINNILVADGLKGIKFAPKNVIIERMTPIIKFATEFKDDEIFDEIISAVSKVLDVINTSQPGYDAMTYFFTVGDEKYVIILCRNKICKKEKDKLRKLALNYDFDTAMQNAWGR
ncbi:MAG: hypothetical protein ACI4JJ_07530 [Huintestinicola sp.]